MKPLAWDNARSEWLRTQRGIGFEEVTFEIGRGNLLATVEHHNPSRYAGQRIFVVRIEAYAYIVPFIEDEKTIFLKTIIPSHKATRDYLGQEVDSHET